MQRSVLSLARAARSASGMANQLLGAENASSLVES
jgi:hypothetical protein